MKTYDVAIIGSGVTGSALLYVLSKYSSVKSIALIEKYSELASVQSAKNNNSQTLHFGDIETNYTVDKARSVKEAAEMVKVYVENHEGLHKKFQKMVLAVGENEIKRLEQRYEDFKELFPKLKKVRNEELKVLEPKVVEGRKEDLLALYTEDGYAIDYGALAQSFVQESDDVDIFLNTPVTKIEKEDVFIIKSNDKEIKAKVVVVAASASSLTFAHKMGYGKDLIILPVAGDFFCAPKLLNGKVYMMQKPKLPFAAVHGDPDVGNPNETRFGPIASVWPILEKRNWKSFFAFLKLFRFKLSAIASIVKILSDPIYYRFVAWNVVYGVPFIGKYAFLTEVRKIVPTIKGKDLTYGRHLGGIRPQVVDTKTKKVNMGEAKILGDKIIFNITPSPGASVCLKNAEVDALHVTKFLGVDFDQEQFDKDFKR